MGLIDLKTDLKSLKYGNDTRGGGSSNQPYVTSPIPDGFAPTSPDFLLRNGYLNPVSSLNDVSRLTKWFTDTKSPNGILFTAKQLLLERQNVQIPGGFNRIYNPAGTLAQAGVLSTGYHLNKQGLNPFQRSYPNGENGYYQFTLKSTTLINDGEEGGDNRLTSLYKIKQIGNPTSIDRITGDLFNVSSNPLDILSYSGGPNSVLGIGNTNIRFTGTGKRERTNNDIVSSAAQDIFRRFGNEGFILDEPPIGQIKANKSTRLLQLNNTYNPGISSYGAGEPGDFNRENTYKVLNTDYKKPDLNPNLSYSSDEITLIPPTTRRLNISADGKTQLLDDIIYSDLIKFYIEVINNDSNDINNNVILFFRAYLESINDGFKADWQSYKYVGRGENFYKYSGFSRDFSLSFKVVAESRNEMIPIYQKLNYLTSLTTPDYSEVGLMRGNFIRLNVGDYLNDVPCIIQSISLKPIFEAGWDINRTIDGEPINPNKSDLETNPYIGQLPKAIDVDMSITPLHKFTSQLNKPYIGNDKHIIPSDKLKQAKNPQELETPTFTLPTIEIVG